MPKELYLEGRFTFHLLHLRGLIYVERTFQSSLKGELFKSLAVSLAADKLYLDAAMHDYHK